MFNIASYLERFKKIKNPKRDLEDISLIFNEVLGFEIPSNSIRLQNNIIFFSGEQSYKTEIFLKKETLLESVNKNLPGLFIKDIR